MSVIELVLESVTNPTTPWVLFTNGTVVFLPNSPSGADLSSIASKLLSEWGPARAGTPSGDFSVISMPNSAGWAVSCHHKDILTFLTPNQVSATSDLQIGLVGRERRELDSRELQVVHVEPGRKPKEQAGSDVLGRLPRIYPNHLAPIELQQCLSILRGMDLDPSEVVTALAQHRNSRPVCLALLTCPSTRKANPVGAEQNQAEEKTVSGTYTAVSGAEGLEALWLAIHRDETFSLLLLAVAAVLDPECGVRALKGLLAHAPQQPLTKSGAQRLSGFQELLWQDPDQREWLKSTIDFSQLCQLECLHSGKQTRRQLVQIWTVIQEGMPELELRRPVESPALLSIFWPKPWVGPVPEEASEYLLLYNDPRPLTEWLLAGDTRMTIEQDGLDQVFTRPSKGSLRLHYPLAAVYKQHMDKSYLIGRERDGCLEVISRGILYFIERKPLQECRASLLVTGIDHDGTMKGATGLAILVAAGPEIQEAARAQLAKTDRSLDTVVLTPAFNLSQCRYVAHVVSTPKHTPESPGWLGKAMHSVLNEVASRNLAGVILTALGTNGGISPECAARTLLEAAQCWARENQDARPFHVGFALPSQPVYEAFTQEFRHQKIFYHED